MQCRAAATSGAKQVHGMLSLTAAVVLGPYLSARWMQLEHKLVLALFSFLPLRSQCQCCGTLVRIGPTRAPRQPRLCFLVCTPRMLLLSSKSSHQLVLSFPALQRYPRQSYPAPSIQSN